MSFKFHPSSVNIEHCPDPIYDEYSPDFNPHLIEAIEQFREEEVNVYVDITRTLSDEGIILRDDMSEDEFLGETEAYAKELLRECGIIEQDALLLIRAREDFVVYIQAANEQLEYSERNPREFENFINDFFNNVRVAENDEMQQAAADALDAYYDQQFAEATDPVPGQEAITEQSDDNLIDVPVVPIAGALVGIAAVGLAGRAAFNTIKRRQTARRLMTKLKRDMEADDKRFTNAFIQDTSGDDLKDNFDDDEAAWLLSAPPSEVPQYHELKDEITESRKAWAQLQASYAVALAESPANPDVIVQLRDGYLSDAQSYLAVVDLFEEEITQQMNLRAEIGAQLSELQSIITLLEQADVTQSGALEIEADGKVYIMPSYLETVRALREDYDKAQAKFDVEFLMEEPGRESERLLAAAGKLAEKTNDPESFHSAVVDQYEKRKAELEVMHTRIAEAESMNIQLKNEYHESFSGDSESRLIANKEALERMQASFNGMQNPNHVLSLDVLTTISLGVSDMSSGILDFVATHDKISDSYFEAKEAEKEAADLVADIDFTMDAAEAFIESNHMMIDDATEKALVDLVPSFDELIAKLGEDKPNFVQINEELKQLDKLVFACSEAIQRECLEMQELENYIDVAIAQHKQEWMALDVYEERHDDIDRQTERDIEEAEDDIDTISKTPLTATAENRNALREQAAYLKEAIKILEQIRIDAESDVAAAKRARAAAAEALRQAELARQRAVETRARAARTRTMATTRLTTARSSGGGMRGISGGGGSRPRSGGGGRRG